MFVSKGKIAEQFIGMDIMKIGIMTFPGSPSFGASLQMYALSKRLLMIGCDVEVINYQNDYMRNKSHYTNKRSSKFLHRFISDIFDFPSRMKFSKFEKNVRLFPSKSLHDGEQLRCFENRYDYIICGSDQVWNPEITGLDTAYFLSFCSDKKKRIAYAPSFGVNELTDPGVCAIISNELKRFHAISVREIEGQKIVEQLLGEKCQMVLDPSMLLEKAEWEKVLKENSKRNEKYCVSFIFNPRSYITEFENLASKHFNAKMKYICGNVVQRVFSKKHFFSLGPAEWLGVIKNAECIITDSFHGAAFSIIFNKPCYFSLESATNSRLKTLVNTFGLEERVITKDNYQQILTKTVKLKNDVQHILENKREESIKYIKNSIGYSEKNM